MIKKLALKLEDQNTFEMLISLISVIYWAKSQFTHKEANITNMAKEIDLDTENLPIQLAKRLRNLILAQYYSHPVNAAIFMSQWW